ncbi:MAG: cupin domain-containing protein [Siphonobacter sp.]
MKPAAYWVEKYQMQPHPEGGYFVEQYRSSEWVSQQALPGRYNGDRAFSTAIYFLLEKHQFSALHRIQSDEVWHFYTGGTLEIFVFDSAGHLEIIRLGTNPDEVFQAVVPAGCWFASRPAAGTEYALVGCTVAPGFDFADFELSTTQTSISTKPDYQQLIQELTR